MSKNNTLTAAKRQKKDEYYTRYADIEKEINHYLEYDPNTFKDKTVLLPCDDPEWSNFTKYFILNFKKLGLRKLISTSYAPSKKPKSLDIAPTEFEVTSPKFNKQKSLTCGKIFTLDRDDVNIDKIELTDLQWEYLSGDGDYRSPEIVELRDIADIIITNPPFSLFRDFFNWIIKANKKFLIIGAASCISYKEVFPLFMNNEVWFGNKPMGVDMLFNLPKKYIEEFKSSENEGSKYKIIDGKVLGRSAVLWLTNLDHGARHSELKLMSLKDNLKHSKHAEIRGSKAYKKFDNYKAIDVPFVDAIPSDYMGAMGVPISFLSKFSPDQFEILDANDYRIKKKKVPNKPHGLIKDSHGSVEGENRYVRVLIKHKLNLNV